MIRFDFSNLMRDSIGDNGLTKEDFKRIDTDALSDAFRTRKYAELEFLDLPGADISAIKEARRYAAQF
ncbi:MAG TPA: hypothetical protein VF790_00490, partial [Dissulfurispiraceae bacterium]